MIDFTPDYGFAKVEVTGPSQWRKHQVPTSPSLPTDIANGYPNGGFGGSRTRGNVKIQAFFSSVGLKRWGGGEQINLGHDSTHEENPMNLSMVGIKVDHRRTRTDGLNPVLTMKPADRKGAIAPLPAGGGVGLSGGGSNENDVPPIVPSDPAFDYGVTALQPERPRCPTTAENNQAFAAATKAAGGGSTVIAAASRPAVQRGGGVAAPSRMVKGPGGALRSMLQRPSRSGRAPIYSGHVRGGTVR